MRRLILTLVPAFFFLLLACSFSSTMKRFPGARPLPKAAAVPAKQPAPPLPPSSPLPPPLPSPLPPPVPIQQKPPFKARLIVIDAGHGGDDLGTQSLTKPRYKEKHLNLATAKMLQVFLQQLGYKILMTRQDDTFLTLEKRAAIANNIRSDLFISVHYNSAPTRQAEGVEVFFYRDDKDKQRVASSKILAQLVLNKIIENTQAKSRGVKHGDLSVIRNTKMPAILVEGGFLTNDNEMQRLKDPNYLKRIAWGIAQGAHAYLNKQ